MLVHPHRRPARRRLALFVAGLSLTAVVSCTRPGTPTTTTTRPGTTPTTPTTASPGVARGNPASYRTYAVAGGGVARWNPCAPIRYVTNTAKAGYPGALADVQWAVEQVSRASGLTFKYEGEVTTRITQQHGNYQIGGAWPPVLIAWARRSETDAYNGITTPGATLAATHAWFRRGATSRDPVIVGGNIAMEPDALAGSRIVPGTGTRSVGVVVMHELGHLVGLDHVNDNQMIMAPAIGPYSTWGAGDLTGLRVVGAAGGCLQTPALPRADELSASSVPDDDLEVISRVDTE